MYQGYPFVALLLAAGVILLIAEALLPAHGVLALAAVASILVSVFFAGKQNPWAAVAILCAVAVATPFLWAAFIKLWPKTPVGKRVILPPVSSQPPDPPVRVGEQGVTISELRPMGIAEFASGRIEAISEQGLVPAGTTVTVIALSNNRPTVRVA